VAKLGESFTAGVFATEKKLALIRCQLAPPSTVFQRLSTLPATAASLVVMKKVVEFASAILLMPVMVVSIRPVWSKLIPPSLDTETALLPPSVEA